MKEVAIDFRKKTQIFRCFRGRSDVRLIRKPFGH